MKQRRDRVGQMRGIGPGIGWIGVGGTFRLALVFLATSGMANAAEHITLINGFDLMCDHRSVLGDKVRLYLDAASANFVEVRAEEIAASEHVDLPWSAAKNPSSAALPADGKLTEAELRELLAKAGKAHDLDVDLLASVVRQESGGNTRAVSRAGAQGLMQLMPQTAADLGVGNAFAPGENVNGGTAYLDGLLRRYHDNLALALAAYNAGPAAVDRWHGIPPYRETRLYVARVIHEFNRRIAARKNVRTVATGTQVATAAR
ncbi:MAG: lytic transglycosylase domain-containing protein [Silvibacterium sp.]